jgi:hypothetical protein
MRRSAIYIFLDIYIFRLYNSLFIRIIVTYNLIKILIVLLLELLLRSTLNL